MKIILFFIPFLFFSCQTKELSLIQKAELCFESNKDYQCYLLLNIILDEDSEDQRAITLYKKLRARSHEELYEWEMNSDWNAEEVYKKLNLKLRDLYLEDENLSDALLIINQKIKSVSADGEGLNFINMFDMEEEKE